jgi:hypothetical protein
MPRLKLRETVNKEFLYEVALGNLDGYTSDLLIGVNPLINIADGKRIIWDHSGPRTKLTAETTCYASSDNAGDTTVQILVQGLEDDYTKKNEIVTLS